MGVWHLLNLLFSAAYWRTLVRGETWRASLAALRRAHKDKRARQQLARTLYLLLVPVSVLAIFVMLVLGKGGAAGFALAWGVALSVEFFSHVRFGKRGRRRRPETAQQSRDGAEPVAKTPELRRELGELGLLHAVLADRAGSERFVKTKELPEGVEVVTRRRHLDLLRSFGVYDRLGAVERDLVLLPDGHWPEVSVNEGSLALEPLRVLRWILRIDPFLPVVGATLAADYRLAGTLIAEPELAFAGDAWIRMEDLETALDAARSYFYRCWAEGAYRGFYDADDEEERAALRTHALRCNGKESDDLLLGNVIVSRADDQDVRLGATLSLRRVRLLAWVKGRLEGTEPALETLRVLYPPMTALESMEQV